MKDPAALPAPGPFDDLLAAPLASASSIEPGQRLCDPFATPPQPAPTHPLPASASNPFVDLLGAPIAEQMAQVPSPQRDPASALIPDDFDPMTLAAVSGRNSDNPLQALKASADDVNTMFAQPSVDAIYSPEGTPIDPMIEDPLAVEHHGDLIDVDSPLDPLLLFGSSDDAQSILDIGSGSQTPPAAPVHNHTLEHSAFFLAPAPAAPPLPGTAPAATVAQVSPPAPSAPIPPVPDAPTSPSAPDPSAARPAVPPPPEQAPADAQQLLDAFIRGAGLDADRHLDILTPELMHMLGQMLAVSAQGMRLVCELSAALPTPEQLSAFKSSVDHN